MNLEIKTQDISKRLKYHTKGDVLSCIEDINPPIFVLPFIMNANGKNINQLFLHEYKDMFGELKTTVLDINQYNFDTNLDVVNSFISKYFSIPDSKIELDRIFYLGEMNIDISLFKTKTLCYGVNLTGLLRDDEVSIDLYNSDHSKMVRIQYYDVMKGHYLDNMIMASTFQLMSYFMI